MKKVVSALTALLICVSLTVPSLAGGDGAGTLDHFSSRASYTTGQFSDVDETSWYGTENQAVVQTACELGIMNGMGDGTFLPDDSIRLSEAIKMATVVHNIYYGGSGQFDVSGDPWYADCVDYAIEEGMIAADDFSDYTAYATRAELAYINAGILPASELAAINTVNSISDVFTSSMPGIQHSDEIKTLYRAGVLTGDAGTHNFRPDDRIARAQAAAVMVRLVSVQDRRRFEILPDNGDVSPHPAYALYNAAGGCLMLGYQSADVVQDFFKTNPLSTQVWQHKDDTKLLRDEYAGADDVRYLKSDLPGGGIYVFGLGVTGEEYDLANGIHCGSPEEAVTAAYKEGQLIYEDHHATPGGYWGDADSTYTYYPGDASPWCNITYDITDGAVSYIHLFCSLY